jgi:hypothetical protein
MTKAIENIVAGYVTLKNREALREIREHRQRLLHESRMHAGSWVSVNNLTSVLQQDIDIVDAALNELQEEAASSIN